MCHRQSPERKILKSLGHLILLHWDCMGQKNFWRRKKNVVGLVAYLHQPLHALDTWGLKKVETWVFTPSSALKRHLLLVLASLSWDSVSLSILQLRNGVNQDIPSLCRSCCKKTGPVSTTNSICKALILSQELCFKWESWRQKDPILPLTSSVLSVMTYSRVISHWELWVVQKTGPWVVRMIGEIQEGFLEEVAPVLSWPRTVNILGRNEAWCERCPFSKWISLIAP